MTKPLRAVLIGRNGQVAASLARALPDAGCEVVVLARPDFDLARPDAIAAAIVEAKPDVVINPAAYTAVDRAEDEPEAAYAINRDAAGSVAAAAARAGAVIIHFSTDYVFDGRQARPYVETDTTGPQGVYGASKLAGEEAVAAANPRHVILRTAWVCSADGSNFLKTMLRLAAERPELKVVDDQHGSPTFAADIAAATVRIAEAAAKAKAGAAEFGIFHLVSQGQVTWCGFARAIMAASRVRGGPYAPVKAITTAEFPTKARRPVYSKLDTAKLARVYGITMPHWQAALDRWLDGMIGGATA